MPLPPRDEVQKLSPGRHGGIDFGELRRAGVDPNAVLDFSVCTNPFMPPPGLDTVLAGIPVNRYPDSRATPLLEKLSRKLSVSADNILVGSGTTELVRLIALAYFRAWQRVVIPEPTYGEYETACQLMGAQPVKCWMGPDGDFSGIPGVVRMNRPELIFVCNPNNPTGRYLARQTIEAVINNMTRGMLVLDEAYVNFVPGAWSALDLIEHGNVVLLRSMTKDYGLAGLRLGYAVAAPEIIANLRRVCPPWNINAAALAAGLYVLDRDDHLAQTMADVMTMKEYLVKGIGEAGLAVLPSDAHYFLVKVGNAADWRRKLLTKGILVRDCASFGLPEYLRVSPRARPDCDRLLEALKAVIGEK